MGKTKSNQNKNQNKKTQTNQPKNHLKTLFIQLLFMEI